ncbi:MAG TPA: hypothetical protein VFL57_02500, partial [Bryobacteraceae bacterium]|nr:hypothetical protein [Bryobacteraceae bacterium]
LPIFGTATPETWAPVQNIIIVQQQPWAPEPEASKVDRVERSQVVDYKAGASAALPVEDQQLTFTIVLRDGTELAAMAVTIEDDSILHYVDGDGRHRRIAVSAINREATQRANRQKRLTLYLPATEP